jgi:TATA-box binding protein (TBP) (component of TFIID and TFIIIB)
MDLDPDTLAFQRQFTRDVTLTKGISVHELASLDAHGWPAGVECVAFAERYGALLEAQEASAQALTAPLRQALAITDEDRAHEVITIKLMRKGHVVGVAHAVNENYVYTTYYWDGEKRVAFNLTALALAFLERGDEFSKNKFAKVTLRYRNGCSHLFFGSGGVVETGPHSSKIARLAQDHTLALLRQIPGYGNIEVQERTCQNIVAKASTNFSVSLDQLKQRYPDAVTYERNGTFTGAKIQLRHLRDARRRERDLYHYQADAAPRPEWPVREDEEYQYYEEVDEDAEYNGGFECRHGAARQREEETDDSEATAHDEGGVDDEHALVDLCEGMLNAEQVEQLAKKNITVLVFPQGRLICTGCKSRREVIRSITEVVMMLERCRTS